MTRFDDLEQFTDSDVENALLRNDPEELKLVPLALALASVDVSPAQAFCIRLCTHPDARVRANSVVSLGHLARRFRRLDEQAVKPVIEAALCDPDEAVRGNAKSAADEIHQFLHWDIAGHVYG
jgi:hypothetical protein